LWGSRNNPGEVVGSLRSSVDHIAKALQPERLKFWEVPTFDPVPFLDSANQATFLRPLLYAEDPEETALKWAGWLLLV